MFNKIKESIIKPGLSGVISIPKTALRNLERNVLLGFCLGVACFLILLLTIILPKDSKLAIFLLDHTSYSSFPYPLTIQNIMYVVFAFGLGDLLMRSRVASIEHSFLKRNFLPEDENVVIQIKELGPIRKRVIGLFSDEIGFLPYLIDLCALQFQSSRSVDRTISVLNSSLELINHRVDLRYSTIRYIVWLIPTLGFIGTVVGIASSLTFIKTDDMKIEAITSSLAMAFNTTIIALFLSAVLVFILQRVQKREEMSINHAGTYTLKNLVNRLYCE